MRRFGFSCGLVCGVVAFVVCQLVFLLTNLASAALPKGPIIEHLKQSAGSALMTRVFEYHDYFLGNRITYVDNRLITSLAEQKQYPSLFETSMRADIWINYLSW